RARPPRRRAAARPPGRGAAQGGEAGGPPASAAATRRVKPHRLVYLGSPAAAVPPLRALVEAGFDIPLVVSQPDRKRGRGSALLPSPVKAAAVDLGIPVSDRVDDVLDAGADLGVVVAFGKPIKPHVPEQVPMI